MCARSIHVCVYVYVHVHLYIYVYIHVHVYVLRIDKNERERRRKRIDGKQSSIEASTNRSTNTKDKHMETQSHACTASSSRSTHMHTAYTRKPGSCVLYQNPSFDHGSKRLISNEFSSMKSVFRYKTQDPARFPVSTLTAVLHVHTHSGIACTHSQLYYMYTLKAVLHGRSC